MSTQAKIAIENKDGTIDVIHCYEEYIGVVLFLYYDNIKKNRELISHGEVSRLREKISPNQNETHNFNHSLNDVCVFYHRDRGEALIKFQYNNFEEFIKHTNFEYIYTFKEKNKKWYIYDHTLHKNQLLITYLLNSKISQENKNKLISYLESKKIKQVMKKINIQSSTRKKIKI